MSRYTFIHLMETGYGARIRIETSRFVAKITLKISQEVSTRVYHSDANLFPAFVYPYMLIFNVGLVRIHPDCVANRYPTD